MTKNEFWKMRQGSSRDGSPASRHVTAGTGDALTKESFMRMRQNGETPWASALSTPAPTPKTILRREARKEVRGQLENLQMSLSPLESLRHQTVEKVSQQVAVKDREYRTAQDKLRQQQGKSTDDWYNQKLDELLKLQKDKELTSYVEYGTQADDIENLSKQIQEAERNLRYAEDMRLAQELSDERDAAKSAGVGSEAWYAQRKAELQRLSEANAAAQAAKQKAYNDMGADSAAGEFAYMFADENKAAQERYARAAAEADTAAKAFQEARKKLNYAETFRWDDTRNENGFDEAVQRGAASDRSKVKASEREAVNLQRGGYDAEAEFAAEDLLAISRMTDDEKQIYHYLLGARGEQEADKYLDDIRETLNARQGQEAAEKIEAQGKGLRLTNEMLLAGGAGIENAVEGLGQNLSSEARKTSATQYASQYARQNIEEHGGPRIAGHSLEGIAYDAANTMANMVPSLAVGAINPIAGAATMGFQSKGNAYKQALDEGYTKGQAQVYSTVTGAAEAGLQYLLGGFSKLGGIEQFTGKMTAKIGKAGLRAAAEIGVDILGENTEEYLQNKLEPLLRNTIFGENNEIRLWDDEDTYTLILTTLTTGMMNGAAKGIEKSANALATRNQIRAVGKSWMEQGLDRELIEKAAELDDPKVKQLAAQLKAEGHKPSARELGELAIAYEDAGGDMDFVIEHALKTDEEATEAIHATESRTAPQSRENATEEQIKSSVSMLGDDAKAAEAAYSKGQDPDKYVSAMNAGINFLAANGYRRDYLDQSNLTAYLTKEQRDIAWAIGHEKFEARQKRAAEKTKAGAEIEISEITPGRVSYAGGTINGVEYKGVDQAKLVGQTKAQAEVCGSLAEAIGVDLTFFDGENSDVQGAYRQGRKIYLNINAKGNMGEALLVSVFSHELTHFAEEYGGTAYDELRGYVMKTLAENDQTKFEQMVEAKRQSREGISYEEALSEVVADGCEMMLKDTHAPDLLARENPTLLRQICDWLDGWVKKIKAAFSGVAARHPEAKILMEKAETMQSIWDKALADAVQNSEAMRENETAETANDDSKKAAEDDGRVQYSINDVEESFDIKSINDYIGVQKNVVQVLKNEGFFQSGTNTVKTADDKLTVEITERGIRETLGTGKRFQYLSRKKKQLKLATIRELPQIIQAATVVTDNAENYHKENSKVQYAYLKSRANIDGTDYLVTVTVRKSQQKNLFWIHEVRTDEMKQANVSSGAEPQREYKKTPASEERIAEIKDDVKAQLSERDNSVTDRELLREAAEREGASEELKQYAKKADWLETYQRRLEKQEAKLKSKEISGEERAALEKRVDETRALIAKTQTALTRMELRPSMQQEIQEARARWWNANMGDAVQTAREIQRENRELKEVVDYYREQAKLTAPENRQVDPADVKRFARALLKEHESSADAEKVSAMLQKLGDKLVRGDSGSLDYFDLKRQADRAAKLIIDEVYKDANADVAEIRNDIARRVREVRLQISDELRGDIPDFNAWRKAHLGRMTLVNEGGIGIDSFYKTLRDEYGKGWFPESKTAHSDQIERIEQILDGMKPKYVYAYTEGQHAENVALVSQEIMDTILSGEIREAETIADRNYRKMQERMLNAREAQHKAEREAARAERRAENAERTALRQAREEQKAITREKVKLLRQELNEGHEARQKRINIERMRGRLSRMLRENSKAKHIAEPLRGAIGEFLLKLDTLGPFSEGTKSEAKYREEMQEIERALQGVQNCDLSELYGSLELSDGVKVMLQNNINTVKAVIGDGGEKVTRKMGLKELQALEETLTILSKAVSNVNELLSDGEHRFHEIDKMAESMINSQSKLKDKTLQIRGMEKVSDFFDYDNTTPRYFFKRLGREGEEIYWRLVKGTGKVARLKKRVVQDVEKIYKDNRVTSKEIKKWESHEHVIKLVPANEQQESTVLSGEMNPRAGERDVFISEAQAMNVYLLNKREQGRSHLYGTGIKLESYKTNAVFERKQERWFTLMPEDVAKITSMLSEQQIKVADELGKYLDSLGKELGNEISMKLYGVELYNEENYWPIKTDSDSRGAKAEGAEEANLYRAANPSFSKTTVRNASNAAKIGSVFDVFAKHSADLINYNAMALPLLDAKRFLDFQGEGTSVQQSIRRAFGGAAVGYYTQLLKDLNGGAETQRGEKLEKLLNKTMSNAKVSSVAANVRVVLQQPTAIARAALMLNPMDIIAGMGTKGGLKEALEYSDVALWKHDGHYDTNISRSIAEEIKGAQTLKSKIQEATLKGAEWGDALTLGSLWNACKIETRRKTGLNGRELIDATVRRYEDVLLSTQVIDGTLMRSQNMRSKSAMMKEFTAFKAEPTLTYNIILDLKSEFDKELRTNGAKAALNKMYKPVIKTAIVWAATNALLAVAQAIGDAGRDDDDYETWWQKFSQHWIEDFKDDMNPLSLVPMLDDLITVALDKDKDLLSLQAVQDTREFVKAGLEWWRLKTGTQEKATAATNYGKMTDLGLAYKGLKAISSWTGIPFSAGSREVRAGYNTIRTIWNQCIGENGDKKLPAWRTYDPGPEREIKNAFEHGYLDEEQAEALLIDEGVAKNETVAKKTIYGWGLAGTAAYKAVKEAAVKGDSKAFQLAMKAMTDAGYTEADVQEEVRKAIKEQYQQPESGLELSKAYCIKYLQQYAGMDQAEAEETAQEWTCYKVTGIAYGDIKGEYVAGNISENRAKELRVKYGGLRESDVAAEIRKWTCEKDTGIDYDKLDEAYVAGTISENEATEYLVKYGGEWKSDASAKVLKWTCEKDTGIKYNEIGQAYVDGDINKIQAVNLSAKYGGKRKAEAEAEALQWQCEKDTGIKYEDLGKAYLDGAITRSKAVSMKIKYGGKNEKGAEEWIGKVEFDRRYPQLSDLSEAKISDYNTTIKATGLSAKTFYDYIQATNDNVLKSDVDENGKAIKGHTRWDKVVAYIDAMNITKEQKDALYFVWNYAEKNLNKTPWHK